ncbi:putative pre-16S rRNA nuclease [Iodidimonas nitroreducens]|uniref:Putative pre-16S rRNA nuclease n=1 Tax=Iodidimonas nitroreducens TaxID=1236968 RepID=A0A5A7NC21_9PROT|nr:Holliday junction resolvase RuvX [Iodidimonas nitroreducens]GAK34159.1 putative Holliday junction resolvase [alpha proteobacterium Q-1]GER05155.1 putative pre-16S rRNA nuclease [Iodidimonas nitroreducens]
MNEAIRILVGGLGKGQRLLGFDVGTKTIGLALSDHSFVIASPLETIRRTKFTKDVESLRAIIAAHKIGGFVIGLPINMDGSEGPRCQGVRQFAQNLEDKFPLPLAFWDERLSSAVVERMLIEADRSRKRRAELVDKLAAAYILQGALDSLHGRK